MAQLEQRRAIGSAGYTAQNAAGGSIGFVVAAFVQQVYPEASPEFVTALALAAMGLANLAGKAYRDWRHDKTSIANMKSLLVLALVPSLWLVGGCAQFAPQDQPVLERTLLDEKGEILGSVKVSLAAELASEGCVSLDVSREGDTSLLLAQQGRSDWATVRGLVSIIPETVAVAMNPISSPIEAIIRALSGRPAMQPPSTTPNPCAVLFEQAPATVGDLTEPIAEE